MCQARIRCYLRQTGKTGRRLHLVRGKLSGPIAQRKKKRPDIAADRFLKP